ncbi:MAG: RNA 2',3'-cyclic phosphodiesterase [Gammaproteobacteria bacterium]|nr:RNA 2',3'-cyclic phosphodiesterase [Gammaproteobacteria bacterium]
MPDSPQRLFFALLPDGPVRKQLCQLQKNLGQAGGRPIPKENLHLTLLFLGNVEADKVDAVRDIAAGIEGKPFSLVLDTLGGFRQNNARILWVGPSESPPALGALHQSLRRQVGEIGLRVGKGTYRPHVTLIRKADLRENFPEKPDQNIPWVASRLTLLASELLPSGSRYRILAETNLTEYIS